MKIGKNVKHNVEITVYNEMYRKMYREIDFLTTTNVWCEINDRIWDRVLNVFWVIGNIKL